MRLSPRLPFDDDPVEAIARLLIAQCGDSRGSASSTDDCNTIALLRSRQRRSSNLDRHESLRLQGCGRRDTMAPRDEAELRRQQIIDGALRTFSRLGFECATNRDIARAAGIRSPRLICRYFKDKTDLLLLYQVVRERMSLIQFIDSMKELDDTPPKVVSLQLAGRLAHPIADRCD
ncbi:MAG: helix-turn-helix domain-containing protein [Chloroflexus sp.]